jgi:predicted DNA-binding protein YlxM (UPF0122 family)
MANITAIRTNKKTRKIDVAEALKLRLKNKMSMSDIAKRYGVGKSAVHNALSRFIKILPNPDEVEAYTSQKSEILSGLEFALIQKMSEPDTIKEASLNNAAYGFTQVFNANRLTQGQSTNNVDIRQLSMSLQDLQAEQKRLEKELGVQDIVQSQTDNS